MKFSLRHQSTGKLYPFLVPTGHLMFHGFFKKVYIHNRQVVPVDKPVLLAVNHPTAFVDPCLLCVYVDAPLYNMTRGDIFRKPFFRKLMESINMFPVFRVRDGYASRDRNDEVFDFCHNKLKEGRVVTIYVEGEHHLEKRVRPLQKGIARIAFGAYERHQLNDLQIIPTGCNYVWGDRPRDEVMVNFGEPIFVRDFWGLYQTDSGLATNRLLAAIDTGLKNVCYHFEHEGDGALLEQALVLKRSERPARQLPVVVYTRRRFDLEKSVCEALNRLPQAEKMEWKAGVEQYFEHLKKAEIEDAGLMQPHWGSATRLFLLALTFLPFLLGLLTSYPVMWLSRTVAQTKAKKREFYSSVAMGVGHIGGMVYYFLWFLAALISWNPLWIAFSLMLPLLGWFSMLYRETWARWRSARRAMRHPQRQVLLEERKRIAATLTN